MMIAVIFHLTFPLIFLRLEGQWEGDQVKNDVRE